MRHYISFLLILTLSFISQICAANDLKTNQEILNSLGEADDSPESELEDLYYQNSLASLVHFPRCYRVTDDNFLCYDKVPKTLCTDNCGTLIEQAIESFDKSIDLNLGTSMQEIQLSFDVREKYLKILVSIAMHHEHYLHEEAIAALTTIKKTYIEKTSSSLDASGDFQTYLAAMLLLTGFEEQYPYTVLLMNDSEFEKKATSVKQYIHTSLAEKKHLQDFIFSVIDTDTHWFRNSDTQPSFRGDLNEIVNRIERHMNAILVADRYFASELPHFKETLTQMMGGDIRQTIESFLQLLQTEINNVSTRPARFYALEKMTQDEVIAYQKELQHNLKRVQDAYNAVVEELK